MRPGNRRDAARSVALTLAAVLAPGVVAVVPDPAALPVTGRQLVLLVAVIYGLVSVALIERHGLDRVDHATASVVVPWLAFLVAIHLVLLLNRGEQIPRGPLADVFRFVVGPVSDLFRYGAAYGLAGAGAAALSAAVERTVGRDAGAGE